MQSAFASVVPGRASVSSMFRDSLRCVLFLNSCCQLFFLWREVIPNGICCDFGDDTPCLGFSEDTFFFFGSFLQTYAITMQQLFTLYFLIFNPKFKISSNFSLINNNVIQILLFRNFSLFYIVYSYIYLQRIIYCDHLYINIHVVM